MILIGTASTNVISCGVGEKPQPQYKKTDLNINILKQKLIFTKTMTGQDAYNEFRLKIKDLSKNIYKNTNEIKNDNTLLISIWTSSINKLNDNSISNLNTVNYLDAKINVTENNKAFKKIEWNILENIVVDKTDLNSLIVNKKLGDIYVGENNKPNKNQAIKSY